MIKNTLATLPLPQLRRAIVIREKIGSLEKELNRITGQRSSAAETSARGKKEKLSAAARARISAAMKARWADRKRKKRLSSRSLLLATAPKPSQPGQLKDRIIRRLRAAGNSGVTVKDLAGKLGKSYGNINVWLHTTAKGVKEIKKVAPGRFAWAS